MNIFILDHDLTKCAQYHTNKHVVKMLVEYTQLLSTTCRIVGINAGYKLTHANHPCAKWTRESLSNWLWLRKLVAELNEEWKWRYTHLRNHKSYDMAMSLPYAKLIPKLPNIGLTPFPQAVPSDCKHEDPIVAYRNYYKKYKQHLAQWTKRTMPKWFN